jgi:hypothetical protein
MIECVRGAKRIRVPSILQEQQRQDLQHDYSLGG